MGDHSVAFLVQVHVCVKGLEEDCDVLRAEIGFPLLGDGRFSQALGGGGGSSGRRRHFFIDL